MGAGVAAGVSLVGTAARGAGVMIGGGGGAPSARGAAVTVCPAEGVGAATSDLDRCNAGFAGTDDEGADWACALLADNKATLMTAWIRNFIG